MTKSQAKARARELIKELWDLNERLIDLQEEIGDFDAEVEDTRDEIEPYENKQELTPQQEERYEWFDNLHNCLEEVRYIDFEDAIFSLEDYIENY